MPVKRRKCDISRLPLTPRASPATVGNWEEQHSTNKKQGNGEKQILNCPKAGEDIGEKKVKFRRQLVFQNSQMSSYTSLQNVNRCKSLIHC
jgi:hypothetical protein